MSGHTPGPWFTCGKGDCSCKIVSCADHPVAEIVHGKWGDDYPALRLVGSSSLDARAEAYMEQITYGEVYEATAKANALLIAAAPDMLLALKALTTPTQITREERQEIALAAIAKAEGPVSATELAGTETHNGK